MTVLADDFESLVMIGAGGHASVLHALLQAGEHSLAGVCDIAFASGGPKRWRGVPALGDDGALTRFDSRTTGLVNGIGQRPRSDLRARVQMAREAEGFRFATCVHPAAWVAADAELGDGVQIMAGAIVQPECRIGPGSIVNTGATVDHGCHIGAHVHIAPGATLCGDVEVGAGAFIAAGAVVSNGVAIGDGAIVAVGAAQFSDLDSHAISYGARGRVKRASAKCGDE